LEELLTDAGKWAILQISQTLGLMAGRLAWRLSNGKKFSQTLRGCSGQVITCLVTAMLADEPSVTKHNSDISSIITSVPPGDVRVVKITTRKK